MRQSQRVIAKRIVDLKRVLFTSLVFLLLSSIMMGQSYRGSIRGKVVDPNGGVIAGVRRYPPRIPTPVCRARRLQMQTAAMSSLNCRPEDTWCWLKLVGSLRWHRT